MGQGIFSPMFDTLDDADTMIDAYFLAKEAGEPQLWRDYYAEACSERTALERRQRMLLIERVVDEWTETKAYIHNRLFRLSTPSPYDLSVDPRPSLTRRVRTKVEEALASVVVGVMEKVRERDGVPPQGWPDLVEEVPWPVRPSVVRATPSRGDHGGHTPWPRTPVDGVAGEYDIVITPVDSDEEE